mgnify:CR=1 FL=1
MTQRERQILNWIEADPMISQQELAERAGITRSSVAVHISNLMKKGCIAGKGYIVTRSPYVTVVGGMNMDIGGWPGEELVAQDSNPGRVRMSPGGVGRNIAHNMSLMGLDVRLLTAFGDDVYAQKLAAVCGELGIDISQSPVIPGGHTSTYLFINDQQGDMQLAVSDMDIYQNLTPRVLAGRKQLLEGSQVVVIDTNLPAESIAWLADNCHAPIFADPGSTVKAEKLRPVLGKLHTLKPNRIEAELLSGVPIHDHNDVEAAAKALLELTGHTLADVKNGAISDLPSRLGAYGEEKAAEEIGVGVPTLRDIVSELLKPGRDVRDELPKPILRTDVLEMKDLKPGMILTGTVRNVIDFGVFVDIGVHQDGLVHISQVCDKFIRHPSEVVSVGDIVKVVVLEVDEKKKRISLSMKQAK